MTDNITQGQSFLEVSIPSSQHQFTLTQLSGTENISSLFEFTLLLFLTEHNINIQETELIGKPISFQINDEKNRQPRYFNGVICSFDADYSSLHGIKEYSINAVPWLWFLTKTADCQIFQNKSPTEIIDKIFKDFGFSDYDLSAVTNSGKQNKRNYCVQYRETTFNFISRLMEEEGIFYYFKHTKDNHQLILSDQSSTCKQCNTEKVIYSSSSRSDNHLTSWNRRYNFYSNKIAQTDYNFETPSTKLLTQENSKTSHTQHAYELFDYPGNYPDIGSGKILAKYRIEEEQLDYCHIKGKGNYCNFVPGTKFTLNEHGYKDELGDYLITEVKHYARDMTHAAGQTQGTHDSQSQTYENSFFCISADTVYRPKQITPKPFVRGPQTAVVVGGSNDEIYVDEYARIKIQFFWDRQSKNDDHSSCWIRVAQNLAGKNWGTIFLPRAGQEVIVDFLEGNPDRPIITGSVYNNDNKPPYDLPTNKTQSGFKTHSSKDGSTADANEIRFEDKKDQEEIYIHAQKDFTQIIENNKIIAIKKGNQTIQIQNGKSTLEAKEAIEFTVGGNSIVIDTSGITINGKIVKVNKG